jgi:acyl carrier protein
MIVNNAAVWDKLIEIMRETFERDDLEVTRDTTAQDVEEWDSVSHIELVVAIESAFGIKLRTGEIAGLKNVGQLYDVIASRVR